VKTFSGICPACGFVSVRSDTAPKLCRNMIEVDPRQFRPCAKRLEEVALVRGLPKAMDARAPAGPARDLAATCRELVRVLETVGAPVAGLLDFDRLHAWARAFSPATVTVVPHLAGFPPHPLPSTETPGRMS